MILKDVADMLVAASLNETYEEIPVVCQVDTDSGVATYREVVKMEIIAAQPLGDGRFTGVDSLAGWTRGFAPVRVFVMRKDVRPT